jgi:hypothetical protein
MAEQDDLEARIGETISRLEKEFETTPQVHWAIVRGLIHRAVHYATEKPGVDFCALATYLGEQIGHAHKLAHGDSPRSSKHKENVH